MMTDLKAIQQCANEACEAAYLQRDDFSEPVNWADLRCVDVRTWESVYGNSGITVEIEEAGAGCQKLCKFIRDFLFERGFKDIEIRTEW